MNRSLLQGITVAITLLPALGIGLRLFFEGPGPEPVDDLTHVSGEWGLRFLLLSLAVTPARRFLGWHWAAPLRRTLGLASFCYVAAHLLVWAWLDMGFDPGAILEDILERPYITLGMGAFSLLLVLAVTSTRAWIKRLGARWIKLHKLVYVAGTLAILHYFWLIKADYRPAIVHGLILAGLLATRLLLARRRRSPRGSES